MTADTRVWASPNREKAFRATHPAGEITCRGRSTFRAAASSGGLGETGMPDAGRARHCRAVFATIAPGLAAAGSRRSSHLKVGHRTGGLIHPSSIDATIRNRQGVSPHESRSTEISQSLVGSALIADRFPRFDAVFRLQGRVRLCPTSPTSKTAPDQAAAAAKRPDASTTVSHIQGDRMQSIPKATLTKQTESSPFRFAEIAQEAGIDFVHFSGMTVEKHFPTANGSGAAIFDFDNDGLLDIYFATCTLLPLGTAEKGPNRLFKNLGGNHFKDVTEASGLGFRGFCHGIITGDIDNDGDQDVFLCNYGSNVLYLNNGNGTFKDISKAAGIDAPNWSSSGAMLDYDNDGFLDIYVSNYGRWTYPEDHHRAGDPTKKVWLYSSPRTIQTVPHLLFHNNGNNTFTNVYDKVIRSDPRPRADGHGFGIVTADVNDDGLIDIFVANDMNPNFLFLNRGDGTFDDVSEQSGAAFNGNGNAQSGMGVDAEDVDGDGLPELFVTNFSNEPSTMFLNYGKGTFHDNTAFFGLSADTLPWVKWGCALADFDNDGWPDVFFVERPRRQQSPRDRPARRLRRNTPAVLQHGRNREKALSPRDQGRRALLRRPACGPWGRLRRHRQRRRYRYRRQPQGRRAPPCCATIRSPETTGSASSSREPRATAIRSVPSSPSRRGG